MFDIEKILFLLSIWVIPILVAITFHEAAHAWVAYKLGDNTAAIAGRVTLNPIKHIDTVGTIIIPSLLIFLGAPYIFGYAKPVPVNFSNIKNSRTGMIIVAMAGPLANFSLAVIGTIILLQLSSDASGFGKWFFITSYLFVNLNIVLGVFNLLPILPLDGGRILTGLLPLKFATKFVASERYGLTLLIVLIFLLPLIGNMIGFELSPLTWVVLPIVNWLESGLIYILDI